MSMATLQLYKNPYHYPDYGSISAYGNSMPCTPVGTGLRNGTIKVKGSMTDFMNCNYMALTRDGKTIYAWIDDVTHSTANSFEVAYTVDGFRTYKNNVTFGNQFIERSTHPTSKFDDMLGADSDIPEVSNHKIFKDSTKRYLVVQLRDYPNSGAGVVSDTPVQPTPYRLMVREYNPQDWTNDTTITSFLNKLNQNAETNIVTIYSVPYIDIQQLGNNTSFNLTKTDGTLIEPINGFKDFKPNSGSSKVNHQLLTEHIPIPSRHYDVNELERKEGNIKLVVPSGGVMNIPLSIAKIGDLEIRRDVDIFSGSSNYFIKAGGQEYDLSSRSSGVSSIPVLSNALDTYVSQNQNALSTALLGDMATIGIGVGTTAMTGGLGSVAGVGMVGAGLNNIINRRAQVLDSAGNNTTPTAMLGSALEGAFNGIFWLIVTKRRVDNESIVHNTFGYPLNKVKPLTLPNRGYVKTQGCSVRSDGTVPQWAVDQINNIFNSGIHVR